MSDSVWPHRRQPTRLPHPWVLQARTLEWVAISFSNAKWKLKVKSLSHVWLFATPWTAAYQAPPPMGFSSQEYWSGVPLPSPKKYVQDLYEENYETLMNEIKELNKWRDIIPCWWISGLNTVKMSVLSLIYRFNEIQIKSWESNFVDIDELILKFTWRQKI